MANRNKLARSKVDEFKSWLVGQGVEVLEPKGFYEVMRWKVGKGIPMAIVYSKSDKDSMHLTLSQEAEPFFNKWNSESKLT